MAFFPILLKKYNLFFFIYLQVLAILTKKIYNVNVVVFTILEIGLKTPLFLLKNLTF